MSVVFVSLSNKFVALCADKQATNMKNNKKINSNIVKVEKWSNSIATGICGNLGLCQMILDSVHKAVIEEGIENHLLEDISDLICDGYEYVLELYSEEELPRDTVSKFVLAGKLKNGNLGVITIDARNGNIEKHIEEASNGTKTLILEPTDVSSFECNQLFSRAIATTTKPNKNQDMLETIHRKAVSFVSKRSKFVGYSSDYVIIHLRDL